MTENLFGARLSPILSQSLPLGRPGLTAWSCLSFVFMLAQYEKYGYVTAPMVIIGFFHFVYNWDGLYFEEGASLHVAFEWSFN